MSDRHYHVVLNVRSGTALAMGLTPEILEQHFRREGHAFTIDADGTAPLAQRIARAIASGAEIIVAAGGDGTATAIAGAIIGTAQTLAILPLGTVNMLARDLGLPLGLAEWVAAMGAMQPRLIDVGEVNGRIFLHKVVIGFVPGIAAGREQIRGRTGLAAKIGFLRFFFRRLFRARRIAVEIKYRNGETRAKRVLAIAVANNDYAEGFGRVFSRQQLDGESLCLYVLKHLTLGDFFRLTTGMFLGSWQQDDALEIESVRAVTIRTRKPMLRVMIDGEIESFAVPLSFRIRPGALSVLAPVPTEEVLAATDESQISVAA